MPAFVAAAALVALLVTYPYGTLTLVTLVYLGLIPVSYRRFEQRLQEPAPASSDAIRIPGEGGRHADVARETKH
jgi:CDP-diacylglycerol--serine O-phosphatidyltransferase